MNINDYIELAKEKQGYKSDSELGRALEFKGSGISYWRLGKALPSDEKMLNLAVMAGINPAVALLDLSAWRTSGNAQETYRNILQKIALAVVIICGFMAIPGQEDSVSAHLAMFIAMSPSIYYGKSIIRFLIRAIRLYSLRFLNPLQATLVLR